MAGSLKTDTSKSLWAMQAAAITYRALAKRPQRAQTAQAKIITAMLGP